MPNRSGKRWGEEAGGWGIRLKMLSAASLGERKGVLLSFVLTEETQEEDRSLSHCTLE